MPSRRGSPSVRLGLLAGLAAGLACARSSSDRCECADSSPPLEWRLDPSDVAIYDVYPVRNEAGKEVRGAGAMRTVFGHDLRDDGQYAPVTPDRADLASILALRLPKTADATSVEARIPLRDALDVVAKGKVTASITTEGLLQVATDWTFSSAPADRHSPLPGIERGAARTMLQFDRARRVVKDAVLSMTYTTRPPPGSDAKPSTPVERVQVALRDVRKARYEGFPADVDRAIGKGLEWLRKQEKPDGSFPPQDDAHWRLGTTALALYTLAECGVGRDDPRVQQCLQWIVAQPTPKKTYEQAVSLMAFDRVFTAPSEDDLLRAGRISKRVRALTPEQRAWCQATGAALLDGVASPGSWSYPAAARALMQFDSSNTQYGALGMRAMSRLGMDIPDTMWIGLVRHFEVVRERKAPKATVTLWREGESAPAAASRAATPASAAPEASGFLYSTRDSQPFASMTCAGIACLELARAALAAKASPKLTPAVEAEIRARVLGAWAWLDRHWGVDRSPERTGGGWRYYYLYALERAAVFSRVREVGGKDWYGEGATQIVLEQAAEGSWDEPECGKVVATCFALLFLKRSTPPLTPDEGK